MRMVKNTGCSMGKESKPGLMVLYIKAPTKMALNMERVSSFGPINPSSRVNLSKITSTEKENILGPTVKSTLEIGYQIRCTEPVSSNGQMVGLTLAST